MLKYFSSFFPPFIRNLSGNSIIPWNLNVFPPSTFFGPSRVYTHFSLEGCSCALACWLYFGLGFVWFRHTVVSFVLKMQTTQWIPQILWAVMNRWGWTIQEKNKQTVCLVAQFSFSEHVGSCGLTQLPGAAQGVTPALAFVTWGLLHPWLRDGKREEGCSLYL